MRRFAINTIIALALGLGLTLALLGLLGGTLPIIQAGRPDNPAVAPDVGGPSTAFSVPLAEGEGWEPLVSPEPETTARAQVNQALFNLPLRFIANAGQADPTVRFIVKGAGYTIFFTEEEVVFSAVSSGGCPSRLRRAARGGLGAARPGSAARVGGGWVPSDALRPRPELTSNSELKTHNSEPITQNSSIVRLRFVGVNPHPTVEGLSPMSGVANFFLGNDPARWQVNVPTYEAVAYRDLYPGIDLVYRGTEGRLKSEFLLAPGADPAAIQMVYREVERVHLREDGALVLETGLEELIEEAPLIYQEADGLRQEIAGGYVLLSPGVDLTGLACPACTWVTGTGGRQARENLSGLGSYRVGFQVGAYNPARPLVIDPELSFASYLGGSRDEYGAGITVDTAGNIYVTGFTSSSDFPTHNAIQAAYGGGEFDGDAFVTQIISAGKVYTYGYSTYLGGGGDDYGWGVAVPPGDVGDVYVTGWTSSSDFPAHNAIRATLSGGSDAFVAQIINVGGVYTLGYSTYLGGSSYDRCWDVAVSPSSGGDVYVTGRTYSTDFPTRHAIQPAYGGGHQDAFVTQIINAGGVYTYGYSTYLGGSDSDEGFSIAVDDDGNAHVTGWTFSNDFPILNAIDMSLGGNQDAFVTQIIGAGGIYTYGYSTYLGGGSADAAIGVAVDGDGAAYVTGSTGPGDYFPTRNAVQTEYGGGWGDAFVTQIISASGVYTYGYSTYLGGSGDEWSEGIAVGGDGTVYATGATSSTDFPTANAIQPNHGGGDLDAFVTQIINASGVYTYGYSTYLGGNGGSDYGGNIHVDGDGSAYVTGYTDSSDFPTRNAVQTDHGGGDTDAFVVKIAEYGNVSRYSIYLPAVVR